MTVVYSGWDHILRKQVQATVPVPVQRLILTMTVFTPSAGAVIWSAGTYSTENSFGRRMYYSKGVSRLNGVSHPPPLFWEILSSYKQEARLELSHMIR